jgi:hypothetical protein
VNPLAFLNSNWYNFSIGPFLSNFCRIPGIEGGHPDAAAAGSHGRFPGCVSAGPVTRNGGSPADPRKSLRVSGFRCAGGTKPESFKKHARKYPYFWFPPMFFLGVRF